MHYCGSYETVGNERAALVLESFTNSRLKSSINSLYEYLPSICYEISVLSIFDLNSSFRDSVLEML